MIKRIDIVTGSGAESFEIGRHKIVAFKLEAVQVSDNERISYYLGLDDKGNKIVEISALCPLVIHRE